MERQEGNRRSFTADGRSLPWSVSGAGVLTDSHRRSGPRSVNALAVTPLNTIFHGKKEKKKFR